MHSIQPVSNQYPNYYVSEHFMYSDFICPCCDTLKIVPGFYRHISLLEELRKQAGYSIIVTSGYRCVSHNKMVGGAKHSWHLLFATDIQPTDNTPDKLHHLYQVALSMKFGGIGRYDRFLHLDVRPERLLWRA